MTDEYSYDYWKERALDSEAALRAAEEAISDKKVTCGDCGSTGNYKPNGSDNIIHDLKCKTKNEIKPNGGMIETVKASNENDMLDFLEQEATNFRLAAEELKRSLAENERELAELRVRVLEEIVYLEQFNSYFKSVNIDCRIRALRAAVEKGEGG